MALPAVDSEARLIALVDAAEPKLKRVLINAITAAKGTFALVDIQNLLEQGRFQEAIDLAVRGGIIRFADATTAVFVLAGQSTSAFLAAALDVTISFDQVNERAVRTMRNERLREIREFSAEQRRATRAALTEGIRRGQNPRAQAKTFIDSIGLTEKQVEAVNNYRRLLEAGSREALTRRLRDKRSDSVVRRAINEGTPLSQAQINSMTGRYQTRFLNFRAETIARTESLRAVNQANDEGYRQAIEEGHVEPQQLKREWHTAADDRVRDSHDLMDANVVDGIEEPFISGNGNELLFPGDPAAPGSETVQCRCSVSTRIGKA